MDVPGVVRKFHKTLLSWDYFGICDKADAGGGVFPDLKNVPTTFKDIQARRPLCARPPPASRAAAAAGPPRRSRRRRQAHRALLPHARPHPPGGPGNKRRSTSACSSR
jgi:hypothetical protein